MNFRHTPQEARKLWVEALRSGEYQQTTGVLHRLEPDEGHPAGFCCLGVACQVFSRSEYPLDTNDEYGCRHYGGWAAVLCEAVEEWLGISAGGGPYNTGALYRDNDNGKPFAEIARIIESNPPGLFKE